jgi:hypothetical protein
VERGVRDAFAAFLATRPERHSHGGLLVFIHLVGKDQVGVKAMVYLNRVFPIPGIFWAVAIPLAAATLGSCSEYSRRADAREQTGGQLRLQR